MLGLFPSNIEIDFVKTSPPWSCTISGRTPDRYAIGDALGYRRRLGSGAKRGKNMADSKIVQILIVFAAVSLAASNVIGAERVMLAELFTATW